MSTTPVDGVKAAAASAANWPAHARFAIYYAPPRASAWWAAGSAWLGRDADGSPADEVEPAYEAPDGYPRLTRALADLTSAPRRYGWHGTLVAPFRLADGVRADDLLGAVQRWASAQTGFALPVEAATLGAFVALRPAAAEGEARVQALAADAVRTFAALRAAPSGAEIERRLAGLLTERQRTLFLVWGYPYVFDEFRFHMTLCDVLDSAPDAVQDRTAIVDWWQREVQRLGPMPVEGVALFVEPAPGEPFVIWRRLAFRTVGE